MSLHKRVLDVDPLTGITTYHYYNDADDTTTIQEVADLTPLNEFRMSLRKDETATKDSIKKGQWLYAQIHPIEQAQFIQKYGFSIFEKGREKEVYKILNRDPDFQRCKTTSGTHA